MNSSIQLVKSARSNPGLRGQRSLSGPGFTLLEVLLVVAVIAILAGIVITAINPAKQLGETRNVQRQSDVAQILNGEYQYLIDNSGIAQPGITTTETEICATDAAVCTGLVDLRSLTLDEKYLITMPKDPQCTTVCATNGTGYKISKSVNGRITVSAPGAESKTISATK